MTAAEPLDRWADDGGPEYGDTTWLYDPDLASVVPPLMRVVLDVQREAAEAEMLDRAEAQPVPTLTLHDGTPIPEPEPLTIPASVTSDTSVISVTAATLDAYLWAVHDFLCRYVVFPSEHEPVAVALWVAHAQMVEAFDVSPILAVTSAEMRSGKTRVLDCLALLVPTPERMVTPSAAVAYTLMAQKPRPTFLLDEADAIFGARRQAEANEPLRAILNSGNRQGTTVPRVRLDGQTRGVERLDVYGAKAIAAIGNLPGTVTDRAIMVRMRRRAPGERVERFRERLARAEAARIAWPGLRVPALISAIVPDELHDRQADSWEPLLFLADEAGGLWPTMARAAAVALLPGDESVSVSIGVRLLADVREAMAGAEYIEPTPLLARLWDMDDAPWGDWYGSPLTARALSKMLRPYGIRSQHRRLPSGADARAYFRQDMADAWSRYLSGPDADPVTLVTDVTDVTLAGTAAEPPDSQMTIDEALAESAGDASAEVCGQRFADSQDAPLVPCALPAHHGGKHEAAP